MRKNRTGERGATMAEFAIIAVVFFMIIFGIIEFGRLFYTHNALTDAARRGARYAVLNEKIDIDCVKKVVVFGEANMNPNTCVETGPPLINGLTTTNVVVTYAADYGTNLGTATVEITNYRFNLSIPFARQQLTMPKYMTTLTAESAGRIPDPIVSP
jgi:Flp pilus assembly protein TadG